MPNMTSETSIVQQDIFTSARHITVVIIQSLLVCLLTFGAYWIVRIGRWVRKQRRFLRKNTPHPPTRAFYGNFKEIPLIWAGKPMTEFFISLVDRFPRMYSFFFGPFGQELILTHPETVKVVLKTSEPKSITFGPYRFLQSWLGEGLLLSSGKKHFRNRRLLTPAFHFDVLKPYMAIYNRAADTLIGQIKSVKGNKSIEIYNYVSLCTLEVILKCAFSFEQEVQVGNEHPYITHVINISKQIMNRVMTIPLHFTPLFNLSSTGREFRKSRNFVWNVARNIIAKRRHQLECNDVTSTKKYKDFLDILLLARDNEGQGLTEEEIRQEVDTFLFEGHDTTASAISWCLHALAEHPDVQTRARQEVDELLRDRQDKDILWDDMNQLPYLSMCIKESLRRTPPVPMVFRELTQPLEMDGITLPTGMSININIFGLHHNKEVWGDDHREYKPERFSTENMKHMDSHAFIGFSAGSRNCIGQTFAMHELKVIIAKVIHSFDLCLDPDHNSQVSFEIILRAYDGIKIFAKPR